MARRDLVEESKDSKVTVIATVEATRGSWRHLRVIAADAAAVFVLWVILITPNDLDGLSIRSFFAFPLEVLAIIGLALIVPRRWSTWSTAIVGLILAVLAIVKLIDMGFYVAFDRPSYLAFDWVYLGSALDLLSVLIGSSAALATVVAVGLLVVGLLLVSPWAVSRVVHILGQYRRASLGALLLGGVGWVIAALVGVGPGSATPVASAESIRVLTNHVVQLVRGAGDQKTFAVAAAVDPLRQIPGDQLFNGLRGKDVILAFVESYGRVALEEPRIAAGITAVLDDGSIRLSDAGFSSRSAFLTSPTSGGLSWFAHATLQSGLWIDSQQRHDYLLGTNRETLSGAFQRAGWRTVISAPSNTKSWPEGERFYRFDSVYHASNVGYRGPRFGYAMMPDQFVLDAFQRMELAPQNRANVMAEIDLVSSHSPWTPLPRMVPWTQLGDGSVFAQMSGEEPKREAKTAYGEAIEYSLSALISYVENFGDPNLVLIILGDHQPATIVSGTSAGNDVPVTIIAHDPSVLARINDWAWQPGMRPGLNAPVTAMDTFRDRFIAAFSD